MPEPLQDALECIAGTDFDETYLILDRGAGQLADWSIGIWQAAAEIRDRNGELLARIANFGTRDGLILLRNPGRLRLFLPGAVTATLPITRPFTNSTDPRIAAWRHRGAHSFVLTVTETQTNDISPLIVGSFTVHRALAD